jgi:hypothetical protein
VHRVFNNGGLSVARKYKPDRLTQPLLSHFPSIGLDSKMPLPTMQVKFCTIIIATKILGFASWRVARQVGILAAPSRFGPRTVSIKQAQTGVGYDLLNSQLCDTSDCMEI